MVCQAFKSALAAQKGYVYIYMYLDKRINTICTWLEGTAVLGRDEVEGMY